MQASSGWSHQSVLYLASGVAFVSVLLRSLLVYRASPLLGLLLGLLFTWVILFAAETLLLHRWPARFVWHFPIYLLLEVGLTMALLSLDKSSDYFAILFCILSMQIMQWARPGRGALLIGTFTPLSALPLIRNFGAANGIAFTLIFAGANALVAFYALTTRRSQAARMQNEALARQIQETNRQLQDLTSKREQLAAARERQRLKRELHDSVTQTIFGMTLATQSAALLMDRDPGRMSAQLDRLAQLARDALEEMRLLIAEPGPVQAEQGSLAARLSRHVSERQLPETLCIAVDSEGRQRLSKVEEQSLFRIAQEAVNNIVKHANASHASIRLHMIEPCWVEIEDNGRGFNLEEGRNQGGFGLANMQERAEEIGWELHVITCPGAGTRIRLVKPSGERRA